MERDPRTTPQEGDRLMDRNGHVRVVCQVEIRPHSMPYSRVLYRKPKADGNLGDLRQVYLDGWLRWARSAQTATGNNE